VKSFGLFDEIRSLLFENQDEKFTVNKITGKKFISEKYIKKIK
jgi:hypothetical protein